MDNIKIVNDMEKIKKIKKHLYWYLRYYLHRVKIHKTLFITRQVINRRKRKNYHKNLGGRKFTRIYNHKNKLKLLAERDGGMKCRYCGSKEELSIDHVIPISVCKINQPRNWQILCKKCNQEKANKLIYELI